jgi:hypothetical protein
MRKASLFSTGCLSLFTLVTCISIYGRVCEIFLFDLHLNQRATLPTPCGLRVELHLPLVFSLKLPIILSVKDKNVNLILPPGGPFIEQNSNPHLFLQIDYTNETPEPSSEETACRQSDSS